MKNFELPASSSHCMCSYPRAVLMKWHRHLMNYELPQGSKTKAELLDFAPRNLHTHVVVASTIPAMRETRFNPCFCPKIPAPVYHLVSLFHEHLIDQQVLATHRKGLHTNVTYVDNDVVINVVRLRRRDVLEVGM